MPLISVDIKTTERQGTFGSDGFSETRVLQALADSAMSIWDVVADPLCPKFGNAHEESEFVVVSAVTPVQKGPFYFEITVQYASNGVILAGNIANPLAERARIWYEPRDVDEPIDRDATGKPYVNSALEPYSGITRPFTDDILYVEKNLQFLPRNLRSLYNTVNQSVFKGEARETCLFKGMRREQVILPGLGVPYWRTLSVWHIRFDGWHRKLINEGLREWIQCADDGSPIWRTIVDADGNPVNRPVPLDEHGMVLKNDAGECGPEAMFPKFLVNEFIDFLPANHGVLDFT